MVVESLNTGHENLFGPALWGMFGRPAHRRSLGACFSDLFLSCCDADMADVVQDPERSCTRPAKARQLEPGGFDGCERTRVARPHLY
jgi:hypothetical protein